MSPLTQKERIATLESAQTGHAREHALNEQVWAARLDAIDARLRGMEKVLLEVRIGHLTPGPPAQRTPLTKREARIVGIASAVTSLLWCVAEVARAVVGG